MSSSEAENATKEKISTKMVKFAPMKLKQIEELQSEEVLEYIEKLHQLLRKKEKKLKKYKEKIKELRKQVQQTENKLEASAPAPLPADASTDATANGTEKETTEENHAAAVCDFVNEIRQAAEQAQNLNGFVYEPTSGLYYDQKTGYYYNAEYGLYYDGNTGCYYHYDQEKNVFEFHSQVERSQKASNDDGVNGDDSDNDNEEVEVEFDEWGVITDKEKLCQIKEKKRNAQAKHKKKSKSLKRYKPERRHKKRKRSRHDTDSDCTEQSDDAAKNGRLKPKAKRKSQDVEDGELSSSSSSGSSNSSASESDSNYDTNSDVERDEKGDVPTFSGGSRFQDIAKKYPPSLRIIVQETTVDTIKVGSLNLITYKGGSLGREGNHDVIIPDVNVSKTHLKFDYDHKKCIYQCVDVGSRNGTILNGTRMSVTKTASIAHDLVHGSVIQIGQTKLLCHVHEGNSTCGLCEPGLLIETARESVTPAAPSVMLTHKEQLKALQKKYGLENEKFVDQKQNAANYNDRAATRRTKIGSSTDGEKTQTASVNTEISSENKGFKMLAKLGWQRGEALGKANDGTALLEPINVTSNEGKKGLGCDGVARAGIVLSNADKRKIATWKKTQQRYQKTDIFEDSDDSLT